MSTSKRLELGRGLGLARLEEARERACLLITDRPAKRYDQTRELAELLLGLKGQRSVTLERGLMVYVYAQFAEDVDRRPTQTARAYYLPRGTVLVRERIDGLRRTTARTLGDARLIMSRPNKQNSTVRLYKALGFAEPTGRCAGLRGGGHNGPVMDKSANA